MTTPENPSDGTTEPTSQPRDSEERSAVDRTTPTERAAGVPEDAEAEMARMGTAVGGALSSAVEAAPAPLAAPAIDFATELGSIDFRKMIGGPLQAAVDAQVASSLATINFINAVGFTAPDSGGKRELVMVDLSHTRKDVDAEGKETSKDVAVRVPLLAMLPIPSLRIEEVVINFNVKLNSVETSSVSDELKVGAEVSAGWGPVNFKVTASYQRNTATNVEVRREYALTVNVKAVQDEMPAGLERVLGILAA